MKPHHVLIDKGCWSLGWNRMPPGLLTDNALVLLVGPAILSYGPKYTAFRNLFTNAEDYSLIRGKRRTVYINLTQAGFALGIHVFGYRDNQYYIRIYIGVASILFGYTNDPLVGRTTTLFPIKKWLERK